MGPSHLLTYPMAQATETRIKHLSVLLTLVAGFCDTVTFVAADSLFSAHVTGNFIVFAYDIVHEVDAHAWSKLVSFPVFVAAVAAGRLVAEPADDLLPGARPAAGVRRAGRWSTRAGTPPPGGSSAPKWW